MRRQLFHTFLWGSSFLVGSISGLSAQDESAVAATRSTLREWIEVQKTISAEAAAWQEEQAVLNDMLELLRTETADLQEQIEASKAAVSDADAKRAELTTEREEYIAAVESIEPQLAQFESALKALRAKLPPPLQEETTTLFNRLPEDPSKTRLTATERLQAVIGILTQADKFNSGVQREAEVRDVNGSQAEVETLYFGLAAAYFANAEGTYGGIGFPGPEGWTWELKEADAPAISRLIGVYTGQREAEFVPVPATIR
jgi:hypothetical protein